jgi:hypothetical protein
MVVFLDVIKYSLRKSIMQERIIKAFNAVLQQACNEVSKDYATDAQNLNVNFKNDIIRIPTGDGAAIIFPFQGLQTIHLNFAVHLLRFTVANRHDECQVFAENGWCNCHDFLDVRIGISEGKAIVFKDINGNYNVAGNPVNLASRVMGLADRQQIMLTDDAYKNMIDMTENTTLESKFKSHGIMPVKHDIPIGIYQYIGGSDENFVNREMPISVAVHARLDTFKQSPMFKDFPMPSNPQQMLEKTEKMMEIMNIITPTGDNPFKTFVDLLTSDKPDDMEKLREYGATNQKFKELRKRFFKDE